MNNTDFETTLEVLRADLLKELRKLRGDTSQAEDALHDACISALKRGSRSFSDTTKLRNFLATSAHGDLITKRGRDAKKTNEYHDTLTSIITAPSLERLYNFEIDLERALATFPLRWKGIIREILEERITYEEAAAELNVTKSTVWREVKRVRGKLNE